MKITIDYHRAFPHISIDQYVRNCQVELGKELEDRKSIYLDLKFWIALRNAHRGDQNDLSSQKLLRLLRELVSSGKVFCPISDSTFLEVFKQSDPSSRRATVSLIDELSLGVSLISSETRMNTEVAHFLHEKLGDKVHPLQHLIWTKLNCVLGYVHPHSNVFNKEENLALQKAFFDHMWTVSLTDIEGQLGSKMPFQEKFDVLASKLNSANELHASDLRSFAQTYQNELEGVLDLCAETATEILETRAMVHIGERAEKGSEAWNAHKKACFALLLEAFKKEATKDALRSIHINTCFHASVRWDKTRMFKENDFMDFHHAAAAIGYCDAFFTERSLSSMIKRKDLALDKRYDCYVGITIEDAIAYLESNF